MTKGKEWLKEEILDLEIIQFDGQKTDLEELLNPCELEEVIDKYIPEPKITEEQAWQKIASIHKYDLMYWEYAKEDFMKGRDGIIIDKPEIPQFVADWIEKSKETTTLYGAMSGCPRELDYWFIDGDNSNQEVFARAWLDGYTVKEEPKYYVMNNENELLLSKNNMGNVITYSQDYEQVKEILSDLGHYQLTEQEIKDYDKRYWAFAERVEEQ